MSVVARAKQQADQPVRPPVDSLVHDLPTTADRIRALALAGYLRTEIAEHLGIRYQQVRQVLERSGIDLGRTRLAPTKAAQCEDGPAWEGGASEVGLLEPMSPARLIDAGFELLGRWRSVGDGGFELDCVVTSDPGVYVFAVDGMIRYVGLTQSGLRGRMAHYVRGHERQRTSARVKGLILAALAAGSIVEILVATPTDTLWNGLPVLTAPSLEAGLIRMIRPAWNKQGLRPRATRL